MRRRKEEQDAEQQRRFGSEKEEDFSAEDPREHLAGSLLLIVATVDRRDGAFCAQRTHARTRRAQAPTQDPSAKWRRTAGRLRPAHRCVVLRAGKLV